MAEATPVPTPRSVPVVPREVKVFEHGPAIFLWPMFVVPLLLSFLLYFGLVENESAAWVWSVTVCVCLMTTTINLNRLASFVTVALLFGFVMTGLFAQAKWNIPIFHQISSFLGSLDLQYNQNLGFVLGFASLCLFLQAKINAWINGQWRLGRNSFEHVRAAATDRAIPRAGMTVVAVYPDLFKAILGLGAGQLKIQSGRDKEELNGVLLLPWRWRRIDQVLEETAVIGGTYAQAAPEVN